MSSSLLYPSYNCKSTCNGFSNSFFVSNDDSTDNDSYSVEEEDAYPNNYLSTDLISSIDQMEPNDKPIHCAHKHIKKIPINYIAQFEPERKNKKKSHSASSLTGKKPFVLRKGDWKCMNCYNINFGFRKCCNRCLFSKESYLTKQSE